MNYIPLHAHLANGSIGDSVLKVEDYIEKAKELDINSLVMTDHGSMSAMIDFYTQCINNNIKPIIGCEVYLSPDRLNKDKNDPKSTERYHLVLLAKNEIGYKNLLQIHNDAQINGFYYKPRTDLNYLSKHGEGIIALSACIGGPIPKAILNNNIDEARILINVFKNIFDDFYLELQPGNFKEQIQVNLKLIELSKETNTPLVITNDIHYLNEEDATIHDLHIKIGRKMKYDKNLIYKDTCYYFMSYNELLNKFDYIDKDIITNALNNTNIIANQCDVNIDLSTKMPKYKAPNNLSEKDYLLKQLFTNFEKKKNNFINPSGYMSRLLYELETITMKNFEGYFLIIQDLVQHAKDNKISVGPGRGSAGGALVSYLLGITAVDPVKNDLMFERFLSPHRSAIPDIDLDFDSTYRQDVMKYAAEQYGMDNCAMIGTFHMRKARASIRDTARLFDIDIALADKAAKLIPTVIYDSDGEKKTDLSIKESIGQVSELRKMSKKYPDWFNAAIKLEGLPSHSGIHAAGMVISPISLLDSLPLVYDKTRDMYATTLPMEQVEKAGFVKIDFLALNTLSVIDKSIEEAKCDFNFVNNKFDDKEVWDLIGSKDLAGLFQISSSTYRRRMHRLKPKSMHELAICLALLRGPAISSGADELYMQILEGKEQPKYIHELYYEATKDTYGVLVFQEQLMQIAVNFGFSLEDGYRIVKLAAKKNFEGLESYEKQFKENAKELDVPEEVVDEVFKIIVDSGQYLFNIAHATCYAHVTYLSAYLKIHYPTIYMKNLLTNAYINDSFIKEAIKDVQRLKLNFKPIDINNSDWEFKIQNDSIVPGMCAIKAFGQKATEEVISKRPFNDLEDFLDKITKANCKKNNIIAGIFAGLFDSIEPNLTRQEIYLKYMDLRKEEPLKEIKVTNHAKSKRYKISDKCNKIEKLIMQAPFSKMAS